MYIEYTRSADVSQCIQAPVVVYGFFPGCAYTTTPNRQLKVTFLHLMQVHVQYTHQWFKKVNFAYALRDRQVQAHTSACQDMQDGSMCTFQSGYVLRFSDCAWATVMYHIRGAYDGFTLNYQSLDFFLISFVKITIATIFRCLRVLSGVPKLFPAKSVGTGFTVVGSPSTKCSEQTRCLRSG